MLLKTLAEYPHRKRLGLLAILLGVISIFAGSPFDKTKTSINLKKLSLISVDDIGSIKVNKLADDIIKSKYDYRLVDLRSSDDYSKYYIPTSENIEVSQLLESDLSRNENILLYSDNDIESAQAWFLLKSQEYNSVNILVGGLKNWQSDVLFPTCTCGINPTKEQRHKHNKIAEVSIFFGGKIQTNNISVVDNNIGMPKLQTPSKVTLKKAKGKKKREGC